jgi:hypothetical protein
LREGGHAGATELPRAGKTAIVSASKERLMRGIYALAVVFAGILVLPAPARADDFPNDVKRTFTTDIPHFFQDDIPCAFGGNPTSGAKTACKQDKKPAQQPAAKPSRPAPADRGSR